jgi:predicted metal-binding membrane protein
VATLSKRPLGSLLFTREAAIVFLIAAVAWVAVVIQARGMMVMGGTMGLGLAAFVPLWTLMMAAMMLPSVAPVAVLYQRSSPSRHALRLAAFAAGYIVVWGLAGIPAFAIASVGSSIAMDHPQALRWIAAGIFLVVGLYQLSPFEVGYLSQCRAPETLLASNSQGARRDVRAGTRHALSCVGCCWALMLVLVVAGIMNVLVMVALAAVILVEKYWSRGEAFSRLVGAAALVLAVAAIWAPPALTPGLS